MPLQSSPVDLGPTLGTLSVLQLDEVSFHQKCLQQNSEQRDSTGGRVYAACHVLCRFIALHPELFRNKRVIEIGCGVGIASIAACRCTDVARVLLTDGNNDIIAIAQENLFDAGLSLTRTSANSCKDVGRAFAQKYSWGDPVPFFPGTQNCDFDVLIGSELCYYNTDMELLTSTAFKLLNNAENGSGLFIHAHIFRKADQEEEMIQSFDRFDWTTVEVRVTDIVTENELRVQDSAWYRVRCLISGPRQVIEALMAESSSYILFKPNNPLDSVDENSDDEDALGIKDMFS